MLMLSGCFHRDETPTQEPTNTQETGAVVATGTTEVISWATDSTGVSDTGTGGLGTGFNTKDFSDPEVEEVIDLLEGMLKS